MTLSTSLRLLLTATALAGTAMLAHAQQNESSQSQRTNTEHRGKATDRATRSLDQQAHSKQYHASDLTSEAQHGNSKTERKQIASTKQNNTTDGARSRHDRATRSE